MQDEKLRELLVSSFFRADNYAVAKEILVNIYCTKASGLGEMHSRESQLFPEE